MSNRGIYRVDLDGIVLHGVRLKLSPRALVGHFVDKRPLVVVHGNESRALLIDAIEFEDGSGLCFNLKCHRAGGPKYKIFVRCETSEILREFRDSREPFMADDIILESRIW